MKRIALVSYNSVACAYAANSTDDIIIFANIFNPKKPRSVVKTDTVYRELLKENKTTLFDQVLVFVGKKHSGSLEIIKLLASSRELAKDRILFVSCSCDLAEKCVQLESCGFSKQQLRVFYDDFKPCREWDWLFYYARMLCN